MPSAKSVLTERQRLVYRMLENETGETFSSVADRLGCNRASIRESYIAACKKKGHEPTPRQRPDGSKVMLTQGKFRNRTVNKRIARNSIAKMEEADQANAMMAATNPLLTTIKAAADEANVSPGVMKKFMEILDSELSITKDEIVEARTDNIEKLFGKTLTRILGAVTEQDIEKASLKDKMIAAGIATEKWLLMRGQPTQILRIEERMKLDELAPKLLAEAKRRGIDLIQDPISGTYAPDRPNVRTVPLMGVLDEQKRE